jgi:hypothetical protein
MFDRRTAPGEEIDVSEAAHVAWIRAQRDPSLWHQAVMAALAYRRDLHGLIPWVLAQPELDRATAGWLFLWPEGSRYLRGVREFPLNHASSLHMLALFRAVCERSERVGFATDVLGLEPGFEAERQAALAVIAGGEVAPGLVAPHALLAQPFPPERPDHRLVLDDGLILLMDD